MTLASSPAHATTRTSIHADDVFSAMSNSRRRQVILLVDLWADDVGVGELAVGIAARENQIEPGAVESEQRKTVYIALIQTHLDTLVDIGAIRYDDRQKVVGATDRTTFLADDIRRLEANWDASGATDAR